MKHKLRIIERWMQAGARRLINLTRWRGLTPGPANLASLKYHLISQMLCLS